MDYYHFFRDESKDDLGRYFYQLRKLNRFALEHNHTYIQRTFPLKEPSLHDRRAYPITDEDILRIKSDPLAMANIQDMVKVMEEFFELPFKGKHPKFFKKGNHNYLRISRILTFLQIMGMTEEYNRFYSEIKLLCETFAEEVTSTNLKYWGIK